jgi:NADPH-dependent 2,4-dienoyl-CoA reductase/sulfur reductase-like enzyme
VVIGAGAAGMAAATRARRVDPHASVVVLESSSEYSRGTCSLPYYVSGQIEDASALIGVSRQSLSEQGIELRLQSPARAIDARQRAVETASGSLPYDRLIVSTGSRPRPVPLLGDRHHPRLWRLRSIADAEHIRQTMASLRPRTIAVVGGGYLGLEMAEVFSQLGCRVTLFHRQSTLMRLDPPCHQRLLEELEQHGVKVSTGSEVRLVDPDNRRQTIEVAGSSEGFDAVFLATGMEPEATLLQQAGARLGPNGGALVDARGETTLPGVFAAGDGVELPASRSGATRYVPLATSAARLGRICGENAAGGSLRLPAPLACIAVRLFSLQVAAVGHPCDWSQAESHTVDFGSCRAPFPRRRRGRATLFVEPRGGRLLGAQMVAPEACAMADLASLALRQELRLSDLLDLDACYTPPLSSLWHPFYLAARAAQRQTAGAAR